MLINVDKKIYYVVVNVVGIVSFGDYVHNFFKLCSSDIY
jgi:hypothetical protein